MSKANYILEDSNLIAGIQKRLQNVGSLTLGNAVYTPAELVQLIKSRTDTVLATAPLKAKWTDAVRVARETAAKVRPVVRALKAYLQAVYGASEEVLKDFGLAPRKARKPKVLTKAKAVVQGKATRQARGTRGKRQKQEIKGTVPATPANGAASKPQ